MASPTLTRSPEQPDARVLDSPVSAMDSSAQVARTHSPVRAAELVTTSAEVATEIRLEQLGFPKEHVRSASASLEAKEPMGEVCETLLASHPDGCKALAKETAVLSNDGQERPSFLRSMSSGSLQVLQKVSSKHIGVSHMAIARLLLRAAAALRQGLLDQEQKAQLHRHLESGDVDLVHAVVLGVGVQNEPELLLEEGQQKWECSICFSEQEEQGWYCGSNHRYCSACMRCHVESVPTPKCPTIGCGYELVEKDLQLLQSSSHRIEAFRETKLLSAIDALGHTGRTVGEGHSAASSSGGRNSARIDDRTEVVLRCPNTECQNAVLVSQKTRLRYVCSCGTAPFCTHCRQAPYHYHARCSEVQPLRERWLEWLTGGREHFFGRAKEKAAFDSQVLALREGLDRHKELEADEQWKAKHCRVCPNCARPVQKLAGCDSMVCGADAHGGNTQPGCGANFGWHEAPRYQARVESKSLPSITADNVSCRGHNTLHAFIDCSLCGSGGQGIIGPRFRCLHCQSFDVCQKCEPRLAELHHSNHVFDIILESDFSWGGIRLPVGTRVRLVRHAGVLPVSLVDLDAERSLEGLCGVVKSAPEVQACRKRAREPSPKRYEWRSDRGRWHAFDVAANAAIVEAVRQGTRKVHVASGGGRYLIDTATMQQRNLATGGCRAMRAVPVPAAPVPTTAPAAASASSSASADPYVVTLDQGGEVILPVAHLEPILQSRVEAERLMGKALQEQEDGVPVEKRRHAAAVEEDEDEELEEDDGSDDDEDDLDE